MVDGTSIFVIMDDFFQAYASLLRGSKLEPRDRLPLFSSLPRSHISLSWNQRVKIGMLGWIVAKSMAAFPGGGPPPKLRTKKTFQKAKRVRRERMKLGANQRGPLRVEFVELENGVA